MAPSRNLAMEEAMFQRERRSGELYLLDRETVAISGVLSSTRVQGCFHCKASNSREHTRLGLNGWVRNGPNFRAVIFCRPPPGIKPSPGGSLSQLRPWVQALAPFCQPNGAAVPRRGSAQDTRLIWIAARVRNSKAFR